MGKRDARHRNLRIIRAALEVLALLDATVNIVANVRRHGYDVHHGHSYDHTESNENRSCQPVSDFAHARMLFGLFSFRIHNDLNPHTVSSFGFGVASWFPTPSLIWFDLV